MPDPGSLITAMCLGLLSTAAVAQFPGDLDSTFSADGIAIVHVQAGSREYGQCVAVQPDGRILVGGSRVQQGASVSSMLLARLMPDGTLDSDFGENGIVDTIMGGQAGGSHDLFEIAVQTDGRIVAVGSTQVIGEGFRVAVFRFNADGTLDPTFDEDGIRVDDLGPGYQLYSSVAIGSDGGIVAAGHLEGVTISDVLVGRYLPNGVPDSTFSGDGFEVMDVAGHRDEARAVILQPDDRIVIAGMTQDPDDFLWHVLLARYLPDGTLDAGFGSSGIMVSDLVIDGEYANALALRPDGTLLAAGTVNVDVAYNMAVAAYDPAGMLDASFGTGGLANIENGPSSTVYDIVLLPSGRIAVSGESDDQLSTAMLLPDGTLDAGFSGDGLVMHELGTFSNARGIAVQPDGKLIVAGSRVSPSTLTDILVLRYHEGIAMAMQGRHDDDGLFTIYPNPVRDLLTLRIAEGSGVPRTVRVIDPNGRTAWERIMSGSQLTADLHGLAAGVYVVRVDGFAEREMIVVQE